MEEGKTVELTEPVIGVSLNVPITGGDNVQTLVFQTHLPQSAGEGKLNDLLDMAYRVTTRQGHIRELAMVKETLRIARKNIQIEKGSLAEREAQVSEDAYAAGRRNVKVVGADAAAMKNLREEIKRHEQAADEFERRVAMLMEKINAAPGAADRS